MFPSPSTATPRGYLNCPWPAPSDPINHIFSPLGLITDTQCPFSSVTTTSPLWLTATPHGRSNLSILRIGALILATGNFTASYTKWTSPDVLALDFDEKLVSPLDGGLVTDLIVPLPQHNFSMCIEALIVRLLNKWKLSVS